MSIKEYVFSLILCALSGTSAWAQHASHADTILNYKTCDGTKWTMTWVGDNFMHKSADTGAAHGDNHANYLTWDKTCWRLEWDSGAKRFKHTQLPNGPSHTDFLMNYITWDDTKWTATRDGSGFYHLFVANADPGKSKNVFDQVNRFLERNGDDIKAAVELLKILAANAE